MKVAIIGAGRVGLPFALSLIEAGIDTVAVDKDARIRTAINVDGIMPFHEPGYDQLAQSKRLSIKERLEEVADCDCFVITVGTPLAANLEADLDNIVTVIGDLCPLLTKGKTIICRSTIAPGISDYLGRLIEKTTGLTREEDFYFAFCPERLLEGSAKADLAALPQIIGAESEKSYEAAVRLFERFGVELVKTNCRTAELAKLILNSSRYAEFAISNYFSMMIAGHGLDPLEVLRVANHKYPRPVPSKPGFSAGTCLRKDYGLLVESQLEGQFLVTSWQINEAIPSFLIRRAMELWGPFVHKTVGVLGLTFKKDSDDLRDSLAIKLVRLIERESPKQLVLADPMLPQFEVSPNSTAVFATSHAQVVEQADIVFVATNHGVFTRERSALVSAMSKRGAKLVDIWDCLQQGKMFNDLSEAAQGASSERSAEAVV
jgi:UDP-N-acetyl-D-mannosaminuronic acid dehydrogenase